MQLRTEGLSQAMIIFLETRPTSIGLDKINEMLDEVVAMNTSDPLRMEEDGDLLTDLKIPEHLIGVDNDPWLVIGEMMLWSEEMELPTVHQLIFMAGTMYRRARHTEWELDVYEDYRRFPAKIVSWLNRAHETPHPNTYVIACIIALNATVKLCFDEYYGEGGCMTDEPWTDSLLDQEGITELVESLKPVGDRLQQISEVAIGFLASAHFKLGAIHTALAKPIHEPAEA